jgi:ABC-type methionine transport system ATPase subunit
MSNRSAKRRFRLVFPVHLTDQPILYRLVRDFDLVMNIRRAHVLEDQMGLVILELQGQEEAIGQGVALLQEMGIETEEIDNRESETK